MRGYRNPEMDLFSESYRAGCVDARMISQAFNAEMLQGNATAFPKALGLVATAAHASINFRRLSNGSDRA